MRQHATVAELVVKPVEHDEELRLANELMAKAQTQNFFSAMEWFETIGAKYPGFRKEHTRIALRNGELAGALRLYTETIRLGEARLKMGGLGWVTTARRHRHRGICTALMTDTMKYMEDHRYHVSMLFGIPNFYHRFGYASTLAEYVIAMDAREASSILRSDYSSRPAKPSDISAIQKIHGANDENVPCSLLRSAAHFHNRWEHFKTAEVFTNPQGKVVAYVLVSEAERYLSVEEVGVTSAAVSRDVLTHVARLAQSQFVGSIRFLVPPEHPFAQFLLQYKSTHEMRVTRDSGGMMAFVDLPEALESLVPEWEHLLGQSGLRDLRCEVTLVAGRIPYRVRANRGAIDVAQISGKNKVGLTHGELLQLITGARYLDDILNVKRRILTQSARDLLAVIFPKRNPYVWTFDRF